MRDVRGIDASEKVAKEGLNYELAFWYRLFDSHGEIATQVQSACPLARSVGLQERSADERTRGVLPKK